MSCLASGRVSACRATASIRLALLWSIVGVGCGGDASGPAYGPPTTYTKQAGDGGTGVVATVATPAPVLHIADAEGRSVPNVEVVFTVASGGGSVTGATDATNAEGNATLGSWTLGNTAGPNTLNATANGQVRAIFSRTGTAGAAATLAKVVGDLQNSSQGNLVGIRPSVLVRDAHGNTVPGATVTFAIATGGGLLTGATPVTDASGVATVGSWRMGASGTNTVTATVTGAPSVTFSAIAQVRCIPVGTLTLGATLAGDLTQTDCTYLSGFRADWYTLTLANQQAVLLGVTSPSFDAFFELYDSERLLIGANGSSAMESNERFSAILPAGTYQVGASAANLANQTGAYSVFATAIPESVTDCKILFAFPGVTTTQSLQTTDCPDADGSDIYYTDEIGTRVIAGRTYTITMVSTGFAFDPFLMLITFGGAVLALDDRSSTATARVVYTATGSGILLILLSSELPFKTGAYTLTIEESLPAGARPFKSLETPLRLDGFDLTQARRGSVRPIR